jgi:dihydrofolate reductase
VSPIQIVGPLPYSPLPVVLHAFMAFLSVETIPEDVIVESSLEGALKALATPEWAESVERTFVIGGAALFAETLASSACTTVYMTHILDDIECDVFIPPLDAAVFPVVSQTVSNVAVALWSSCCRSHLVSSR